MSDSANVHQAGIQINFNAWERFNLEALTNDGVVLFQYLVFHCQHNAEWTHSDNDLRYELGIKRSRITVLRDKFAGMGFLDTQVVKDRNDNNIRAYRIKFSELAKLPVLSKVYRSHDVNGEPYNLNQYSQIYKAIAASQPKPGTKVKVQAQKESSVRWLANALETIFVERRDTYNEGIKKRANAKSLRLSSGMVKFSPKHLRQLANAVKAVGDDQYIKNAFLAYCDTINSHQNNPNQEERTIMPTVPRSPLNYFLSYSTGAHSDDNPSFEGNSFSVIYSFGEYFAARYGRNV